MEVQVEMEVEALVKIKMNMEAVDAAQSYVGWKWEILEVVNQY